MATLEAPIVPTVEPRTEVPDDYQHVQASPADFGGLIAQGAEKFGAGASEAGKFFGEVQTDDALNGAMTTVNQTLDHFRSLRGADALNAQADTQAAITSAFKSARDGLNTPFQQKQFDDTSRMYQQRYIAGIVASHADQEAKSYATQTNASSVQVGLNNIANVADDPAHVEVFKHDIRNAMVRQVQLEGNGSDPTAVQAAIEKADQAVYKTQAETIAVKSPAAALALVEQKKQELGTLYEPLANQFRTRANEELGQTAGAQAIADTGNAMTGNQPVASPTGPLKAAIFTQESGGRNIPNPAQVQPATFAQYAKPGETITHDSLAVGGRAIDDLAAKYPNDPARVAVGYFSGAGNVAPAGSPTPWIRDAQDVNGKTVSSYVSDITARLQSPGITLKAGAYERLIQSTKGNPQALAVGLRFINEQYSAAATAAMQDEKAKRDANDKSANGIVTQAMKGDTKGAMDQVMNDPSLNWETRARLPDVIEKYATDDANKTAHTYGQGFSKAYMQVTAPVGDPDRLTDTGQILRRAAPGGDLNLAGAAEILKVRDAMQKPEGAADAQIQRNFMTYAQGKFANGAPEGWDDPKSKGAFNDFYIKATQQAAQLRDKGVAEGDIWDTKGPMGKLLDTMSKPQGDPLVDRPGQAFDMKTREGVKSAYFAAKTQAERDQIRAAGLAQGFFAPNKQPAPAAPSAPIAQ